MADRLRDSFLDLEIHRKLLEENIEKLRKSLRHWQTWEAEYEGLKEEILAANPIPHRTELVTLAREYEGDLVNRKEVEELLGPDTRDAVQIVNLLDRRLDYVEQNVRALQKQLDTAEEKLVTASIVSTPEVMNEEGLPMTEIIEELDDEGNVISGSTSTPSSTKPQILEVLKKAGVELPATSPTVQRISEVEETIKPMPKTQPLAKTELESRVESATPVKKGVKFTEDTKSSPEPRKSHTAKRIEEIMSIGKRLEATSLEPAVIPTNESTEDAALRSEMLQYGMSEVGAVVAELDLEEGSDWGDEDYENETDDEDAFGRSRGKVVDDEVRQRMIELEERLGVRIMENVGKKASEPDIVQEGIGRITVNGQTDNATGKSKEKISFAKFENYASKKSVRFSEELGISPAPKSVTAAAPIERTVPPVSDIVERTTPAQSTTTPEPQKNQSRFKSARATAANIVNGPLASSTNRQNGSSLPLFPAKPSTPKPFSQPIRFTSASENTRTVPTGPESKTLAARVIERDIPFDASVTEPDELDPQLLHQEVATEYHRMRNRMIQRQGGFMKGEENEIVPLTEEEGGQKKMSRFKAARLAKP